MKSMRNFLSMMSVAMLMLFAIGCEPDDTPTPGGEAMTFNFANEVVTPTSVEVTVVPSDTEKKYYAGIVSAWDINTLSDAEIIGKVIDGNIKFKTYSGVQVLSASALKTATEYVAIAFEYGATDTLSRFSLTTEKGSGILDHESFEVNIEVSNIGASTATAVATPNGEENRYFFRVLTKMELSTWGIYENDLEIMKYIIENPNSNKFIFSGTTTLEYDTLAPKTDYLAIAFNVENYEAVLSGEKEVKLFRKEFVTEDAPEVDPNTLFTYTNLKVDYTGFTLDVTPVKGDDKLWTYYIFEKQYYEEYLAKGRQQVVMRAYFGLYNLRAEYNALNGESLDFNQFINDYMGQYGQTTILNYEPLKPQTDYVVAMFYMDTEVYDPTEVYDYNFVAVPFTTLTPDVEGKVQMDVVGPNIVKEGFNYTISFNVAVTSNAIQLKYGAAAWSDLVAQYYDPEDPTSIRAFVNFKTATDDILATAMTQEGATIQYTLDAPFDGIFFFETANDQGALTQYMVRVTPDMF